MVASWAFFYDDLCVLRTAVPYQVPDLREDMPVVHFAVSANAFAAFYFESALRWPGVLVKRLRARHSGGSWCWSGFVRRRL